jgi:hypothetical protein
MPHIRICTLYVALCLLPGCASDKHFSQTELTTLQSREFDASYEATYTAAVNALFDAGYTIGSSDKDAGFVAASRTTRDAWSGYAFQGAQVKVDAAGRRTSVRVSTSDGMGQQKVNKKQIDELLNLIDRRLVGDLSTGAVAPPDRAASRGGPGR